MKRMEMIFSQSIEDDILESLKDVPAAQFFTLIPGVRGRGYSTPKMDSPVWPEVNELMIIYCDDESAREIEARLERVRERYPNEGLAIFTL
jgi:hypothetical protein